MGFCDGTSGVDTTRCAPCNFTSCKTLETLVGQCTGRGTRDTSQCVMCSSSTTGSACGTNQFMSTMCTANNWYNGKCSNCNTRCIAASDNSLLAPTGQFRLIPCSGRTSSNLVCANCTQVCPVGHYISNLCNGTADKDTTVCTPCTCPPGFYAPNNTCTGRTTRNVLQCVPCTQFENCTVKDGYFLSGTCSTFENTACSRCRSECQAAEVETQACADGANRHCLPDISCYKDCPSGFYESVACRPPNVAQNCTRCTQCPVGYHIKQQCSGRNDTICQRCTSSICTDDDYNAQFAPSGGCQGTELFDNVRCGVITESFGERCSTNSFRFQQRIPLQHAWGAGSAASFAGNLTALQKILQNDTQFMTSVKTILGDSPRDYLAFDVHPNRMLYAYCSGNAILTYDYTGVEEESRILDFAYVPEPCSDIRFSSAGNYLMVTSTESSRLFRCDPQCSTTDPFVQSRNEFKYVCAVPHNTTRRWGEGNRVHCMLWVDVDSYEEDMFVDPASGIGDAQPFRGGLQVFGSDARVELVLCAVGSYSPTLYSFGMSSSWVYLAYADFSPFRGMVHTFPPGIQILGPPAYNSRLRRLFVPAYDHGNTSRRLIVYQLAMRPDGTVNSTAFVGASSSGGISEFFVQLHPGGATGLGVPAIPGFALRLDTGAITIVDETYRQIHVLLCATHASLLNSSASSARCSVSAKTVVSTSYGASAYKDVEFIGLRVTERDANPLSKPSKLFFTSLQNIMQPRAELYVQCAKCYGDSVTSPEKEALSNSDCFCAPGFMISAIKDVGLACRRCRCMDGQYLDETSSRQLCDGKGLSKPGCKICYVACEEGSYMRGSCDGSQTVNPMECLPCTMLRTETEQSAVCPSASKLAVRRGTQTIIYSASAFRSDCTYAKRLDCARRQALTYPFDGNDLLEDLAPRAKRLVPMSASERSKGPTLQVFFDAPKGTPEAARPDDALFFGILAAAATSGHMRTAAAHFNSSNHEYYQIPVVENLFDPTLAVKVVPSRNRSLFGDARRIQSTIEWEQGVTLCMWYRFGSDVGASQTLFELSNGYNTEHMYVRRVSDSWDLAFGVYHSHGSYSSEHRTTMGRGVPRGAGYWNHLCWSIRHQLLAWADASASASNGSNSSNGGSIGNITANNNISGPANNTSSNSSASRNDGAPAYYLLPESLFVWSSVPFSFSQASSLVGAQAMAGYSALWDIHINGGGQDSEWASSYEGIQGVMPVEGTYSVNFIAYSTSFPNSFFHGSVSDLRLFERPLDKASMRAIFSGDACCRTFVAGSYIDTSNLCSAPLRPSMWRRNSLFNSEFCRSCKSDCGPFHYIDNEANACGGTSTFDTTICKQCMPCARDQYMNQTCTGTSFSDEASCPPCR